MCEGTNLWDTKGHPAFKPLTGAKRPLSGYFALGGASPMFDEKWCNSAPKNLWIATEKVHGSNMSFICNGDVVVAAKREDILAETDEENESFFNFLPVKRKYESAAAALYAQLKSATYPGMTKVTIFGELFGGLYPPVDGGSDGAATSRPVQEGVYYSPAVDFIAYDVEVELSSDGAHDERRIFLNVCLAFNLLKACGFMTPPVTAMGDFATIVNSLVLPFPTLIPTALFRLPPMDANFAEGYVCKTVEPQSVPQLGSGKTTRAIFKRKLDKFAEVMKDRERTVRGATPKELAAEALRAVKSQLLNANMLASARSKAGRGKVAAKDVVRFLNADVRDALDKMDLPFTEDVEALIIAYVTDNT